MTGPVRYHLWKFPPETIDWERLLPLIGEAHRALARYDALLGSMPNPAILRTPLLFREAAASSGIEGTHVTIDDTLTVKANRDGEEIAPSKRADVEEVSNYRRALALAVDAMAEGRPLSRHLLCNTHRLLMGGVRGHNKAPGALRDVQNWIGPGNSSIEQADFIPIPQEYLHAGFCAWADYVQERDVPDPLVQLAIAHVEFEALHPFKDGNGRLGRIFIPLFLVHQRILGTPSFYFSGYLEARREEYVGAMRAVSRDGAWTEWCGFFLRGLIAQASWNHEKAARIRDLHRETQNHVADLTGSRHSNAVADVLFSDFLFESKALIAASGVSMPGAQRILSLLCKEGILKIFRKRSGRTPALYVFPQLLELVREAKTL